MHPERQKMGEKKKTSNVGSYGRLNAKEMEKVFKVFLWNLNWIPFDIL